MITPNLIDILKEQTEQKAEPNPQPDNADFEPKTEPINEPNPDDFEPKAEETKTDFSEFVEPKPVKPEKPRLSESEYAQSAEMCIALVDGLQTLSLPWLYQKSLFKKEELQMLKELKARQKKDGSAETSYTQTELSLLDKYRTFASLGLCVGLCGLQMCQLCVGRISIFFVRWGKNKKHSVGQRVGLDAVLLQYGLYVFGHLSKWFVFVLVFKFWSVCRLVNGRPTIGYNVLGLGDVFCEGDLMHKSSIQALLFIIALMLNEALSPPNKKYSQTPVSYRFFLCAGKRGHFPYFSFSSSFLIRELIAPSFRPNICASSFTFLPSQKSNSSLLSSSVVQGKYACLCVSLIFSTE